METPTHRALKRLAVARLFADGCAAAAEEVACPIARFRVDAAGYLDPLPRRKRAAAPDARNGEDPGDALDRSVRPLVWRGEEPRTVIVECKASRADFLIDARDAERLLKRRDRLRAVRVAMEESFVKVVEPHLRRDGTSLFAEMDEWNFADSRLPSYRALLKELESVDEHLYGQSKFWTVAYYRLADFLYIAAPAGTVRVRELPTGWGLIEFGSGRDSPMVALPAPLAVGNRAHRLRLLRNIAAAASRRCARSVGSEGRPPANQGPASASNNPPRSPP